MEINWWMLVSSVVVVLLLVASEKEWRDNTILEPGEWDALGSGAILCGIGVVFLALAKLLFTHLRWV